MTTRVEFHTGVADAVDFACRLLRKACHQGVRVLVRAPGPVLGRVDRGLWTQVERDFLPHLRVTTANAASSQARRSPIWLTDGEPPPGSPPVLVNLGAEMPASLDGLQRIIEIVSAEPADAAAGRDRWKRYRAAGLTVQHHDAAGGRHG